MADLREDFVKYVVKALVTNPDAVDLRRSEDDKGEYLELTVDPADMGKVIGKAGATAKSIRTLLRGVGAKDNLPPLPLKIVDPEEDPSDNASAPQASTADNPAPTEEEVVVEPEVDEDEEARQRHKKEAEELADLEL
jgi:predicted RNA-binding protein YlqC (UPF0109 family)